MIFHSDPAKAAGMDTAAEPTEPSTEAASGLGGVSKGAGPSGTSLTQGDLNFQGHGMGKVLSQRLPGLLAGSSCSGSAAAQLLGLLHRVASVKKKQLMISNTATKTPSQQVVLQNSNELSILATPRAPLALHGDAAPKGGQGREKGRHHW